VGDRLATGDPLVEEATLNAAKILPFQFELPYVIEVVALI